MNETSMPSKWASQLNLFEMAIKPNRYKNKTRHYNRKRFGNMAAIIISALL